MVTLKQKVLILLYEKGKILDWTQKKSLTCSWQDSDALQGKLQPKEIKAVVAGFGCLVLGCAGFWLWGFVCLGLLLLLFKLKNLRGKTAQSCDAS